jgi:fructose-bisphosphate aldolase, class II
VVAQKSGLKRRTPNDDMFLMIVSTAALYRLAYRQYAIGAYNIDNLEQILGLFRGCIESQAPFIIQISKGARSYADKRMLEVIGSAGRLPEIRKALVK